MAHDERTRHITKIILDDLKDAEMRLGYAKEANEEGSDVHAAMFRDEAHRRLDHAKEWYERLKHETDDDIDDGVYEAMKCHFKEWYHSMRERIEKMHE